MDSRKIGGVLLVGLLTCLGCEEGTEFCQVREPEPIDPDGLLRDYVVDSIDLPNTAIQAVDFGMVLDGNPEGRSNNSLGQILSTVFNAIDSDVDGNVQAAVDDGRILHLVQVQTASLADAGGVGVSIAIGVDDDGDAADNFSGDERFEIEPGHPMRALSGEIDGGHLTADLGAFALRIALPHVDEAFTLDLEVARIEAEIGPDGIDGKVGGVVLADAYREQLLPVIYTSLSASVALDCDAGICEPDSHGRFFLDLFDEDRDGQLSFEEIEYNSLINSLLAPDVDLFDEDGAINPRCDGVKESLSVGLRFTAVPARFAPLW
jgi:hypothetical protein